MTNGDRVEYHYVHSLNSKSKIERFKPGSFIRWCRARNRGGGLNTNKGYAIVQLDGNKGTSKIHISQLKPLNQ